MTMNFRGSEIPEGTLSAGLAGIVQRGTSIIGDWFGTDADVEPIKDEKICPQLAAMLHAGFYHAYSDFTKNAVPTFDGEHKGSWTYGGDDSHGPYPTKDFQTDVKSTVSNPSLKLGRTQAPFKTWIQILQDKIKSMKSQGKTVRFFLSGHSLGAALATLATYDAWYFKESKSNYREFLEKSKINGIFISNLVSRI